MKRNQNRNRHVDQIAVLIEAYCTSTALGVFVQSLEQIEKVLMRDIPDFEGSEGHKNIEYQKKLIEFTMNAIDLKRLNGSAEKRKESLKKFLNDMKSMGIEV